MIQGGWCTGDLSEVQSELQEGGQDLTRRGFQEEVAQLVGGKGRCTGGGKEVFLEGGNTQASCVMGSRGVQMVPAGSLRGGQRGEEGLREV